jgi:segregation and condensation protein B
MSAIDADSGASETAARRPEPPEPLDLSDRAQALRLIEAILFAAAEPVGEENLAERLPDGTDIAGLLAEVAEQYAGRGVNLVKVAGRWALRTAPDLAPALEREKTVQRKLSRAAVETMAIIAYHQPVTRAEIESIRGVALSRGTLDQLMEAGWILPKGRRHSPGRPATWVTTDGFLEHFGLDRLDDLPGIEELRAAGLLDTRPGIATMAMREEEAERTVEEAEREIEAAERRAEHERRAQRGSELDESAGERRR